MAETDQLYEFGREPGFSRSVFALTVLICYTWRFHQDVSWMLYHRKTNKFSKFFKIVQIFKIVSKIVQISKLGFIFGLWGWAGFLSVDWFPACSDSEMTSTSSPYTPSSTINWPHHLCVPVESSQIESGVSSLVCLCHGSVYWASMPAMPEVCQHARGSSLKCLCFPGHFLDVPAVLDVLKAKTLCHCARWLKTHKTVLMA